MNKYSYAKSETECVSDFTYVLVSHNVMSYYLKISFSYLVNMQYNKVY